MAQYIDFLCKKPGEDSFAENNPGLPVGYSVAINGEKDLSKYIQFAGSGCVYSIHLKMNTGKSSYFDYVIEVDGRCFKKGNEGIRYLYFTDSSEHTHELKLIKSGRRKHLLHFNSRAPQITSISWSNVSNKQQ